MKEWLCKIIAMITGKRVFERVFKLKKYVSKESDNFFLIIELVLFELETCKEKRRLFMY